MQMNRIVMEYYWVESEFVSINGAPLKMSKARKELATGDSKRVESHGLSVDSQTYIMAIVLSERP